MKEKSKMLLAQPKKRIGFDLDGVLIDHKKNRCILARRLGYKNITEKTSVEKLKKITSKEDYKKIKKDIYGKMTLKAGKIKDSGKILAELGRYFDLFVISRRQKGNPVSNREYGRKWLKKHFDFPKRRIFFVENDKEKGEMVRKLGICAYIDDKISVLKFMPKGVRKFLFDELCVNKTKKAGDIEIVYSLAEFFRASGNF